MTETQTAIPGKIARFADVCERIDYGFTASADFSIKQPRLLRITDIQDGTVEWATVPGCRITPKEEEENRLLVGDIVFARTGATTGKSFLIRHTPRAVFASYLIRLRMSEDVLPQYFAAFCQSELYWRQINREMRGSTQGGVNSTLLGSLRLPLPPLPEQKRITAILERADRLRRVRRYGVQMAQGVLPATFRQMFGDPVSNAKGWKVVSVEEAGKVQLGRQRAPQYQTGKHRRPYVRVANVYEDRIDLSDLLHMDFDDEDFAAYRLEHRDILLNEGQSTELVGRPAIWRNEIPDCCFQNTLVRFQPNRSICLPEFALWVFVRYLHAGEFAKISAKTSNVAHLGASRLAQMRMPIPPLELQAQFAEIVQKNERMRALGREALRQAEHLFQTLLHRAFTTGV